MLIPLIGLSNDDICLLNLFIPRLLPLLITLSLSSDTIQCEPTHMAPNKLLCVISGNILTTMFTKLKRILIEVILFVVLAIHCYCHWNLATSLKFTFALKQTEDKSCLCVVFVKMSFQEQAFLVAAAEPTFKVRKLLHHKTDTDVGTLVHFSTHHLYELNGNTWILHAYQYPHVEHIVCTTSRWYVKVESLIKDCWNTIDRCFGY